MIPIRILLVEDPLPFARILRRELEATGSFEVFHAASAAAGMISLARLQPDVLVINPAAGGGTAEEWRRAVQRYRGTRSLGLIALTGAIGGRDQETLCDLADLGVLERPATAERIHDILMDWVGEEELLGKAS